MRAFKSVLLFSAVAVICVSAATTPAPTKAATAPPAAATPEPEIPAKNGTSVKVTFSPTLVKMLQAEDQPSVGEPPNATLAIANFVNSAALKLLEANNLNYEAENEKDPKRQASLKEQSARFTLHGEQSKRQAALLFRQLVKASSRADKETKYLEDIAKKATEIRTAGSPRRRNMPTASETAADVLRDISIAVLEPKQIRSEIRKIKADILENAAMQIQQESLDDEIENEPNPSKVFVLETERDALIREREAMGAILRNRLMRLANKANKTDIENRIAKLEADMELPIYL